MYLVVKESMIANIITEASKRKRMIRLRLLIRSSQLFLNLFVALIFRVAEHVIIIRRSPAATDDIDVSRTAASRICHYGVLPEAGGTLKLLAD